MGAILPLHILEVNQAQKGFVHEGSRLEGVSDTLLTHVAASEAMQFLVDPGRELLEASRFPPP